MSSGEFIKKPDRRVKLLLLIQGLWVATLIVLILWWSTVIRQKSDEIATLQTQLGIPETQIQNKLERTERMIQGESGSLLLLILITNGILFFFYARDHRRSKSLQAFFASVTHELRTPLTSIKLQAEALRDIEDNPKHTPYIHRLLEDVERLEGQVQKTLELARLEGGGSLNNQPVQLRSFFQNKFLGPYHSNSAKIKVDHELADGFVIADTAALHIILRNIFDNAIRYSLNQPALISVVGKTVADQYSLEIAHTNSQFEGNPHTLGKLFYRGKNSQGAGVGLFLVDTLMEKMKGRAIFTTSPHTFITQLFFGVDHGT